MPKNILITIPALLWLSVHAAQAQTPVSAAPNSWGVGTPMPTARRGPFTGVIGAKIYAIGGATSSAIDVNEIYDTTTNTWSTGASMPTARWLGASAVVNNVLYAIGGRSSANVSLSVVEAYDPSTNTWSTMAPMPIVNDNIYATVENNIIYVIGGFSLSSGQRLTNVFAYNPSSNIWNAVASLKVGKSLPAVGLVGSTIVAAGGLANSGVTADNEGYNAATNSWEALASEPTAVQTACFVVSGGLLYLAGGLNAAAQAVAVTQAYSLQTNSWTTGLASMPYAVGTAGSAIVGGTLYCLGGENSAGASLDYVQIYQPAIQPPAITPGGVVSASAFGGFTSIAPGSWIEIYGSNLASDTRSWGAADFNGINAPTSLDGTTVTIGGQYAFIDYISPGQVNALVPSNVVTGPQQVTVTTPSGMSGAFTLTVNAAQPGLLAPLSFNLNGTQYVVALFLDGSYVLPTGAIPGISSRPAKAGDTIVLYGVGFGPVIPNIPAGQLVGQSNAIASGLQMAIGGQPAMALYSGLAPNYTGLYQFNLVVPNTPVTGTVPFSFTLGGTPGTQTLNIAVQD